MKIDIKTILGFIIGATFPIWLPLIKEFFNSSENKICVHNEYLILEDIDQCKAETGKSVESCVDEAWERHCE
jgi:hypothetical protein